MIMQPSINQDLQVNKLYLKRAVIKNAQGKNITIQWGNEEVTLKAPSDQKLEVNEIDEEKESLAKEDDEQNTASEDENKQASNEQEDKNVKEQESTEANSDITPCDNTNTESVATEKNENIKKDSSSPKNTSTNKESSTKKDTSAKKDSTTNKDNASSKGIQQKNINTYYGIATNEAFNIQVGVGAKIDKNGKWVNASAEEIKKYFVPTDAVINKYKYQFLNLASLAGISESEAKKYLNNKGILSGKESIFIEAAKENNINEIYLMAHACLETGNGTSKLATGVEYKGTVVYNMFGIHAYDSDPIGQGAAYAYKMGWTTPEKAITGGAKFISTNYINNFPYNQDTLYEMRWNPANPGDHQYATDVAWAIKQAEWIGKVYSTFESATVTFDIPIYRK